eukprot:267421_1
MKELLNANTNYNDDILIHQSKIDYVCSVCCCMQIPDDVVTWNYVAPTPALEQRGLTPQVLRNEIDTIQKGFAHHTKLPTKFMLFVVISALLVFIAGNIGTWTSYKCSEDVYEDYGCSVSYVWLGVLLFGFVVLIICWIYDRMRKSQVIIDALEIVKEYVEVDLNEKYQKTKGIRWSIIEEKLVYVARSNQGAQTTRSIKYYHIGIRCVSFGNNDTSTVAVIVLNNNNDAQSMDAAPAHMEMCEGK